MPTVKVLSKGQITLPKHVREKFGIRVGDALVLEEGEGGIVLKKVKTIFDYAATLPNLALSIEEIIETANEGVARERV